MRKATGSINISASLGVLAGLALMAGCSTGPSETQTEAPTSPPQTESQSESPESSSTATDNGTASIDDSYNPQFLTGVKVSPASAAEAALDSHPDTQVTEISLEDEDDNPYWEVQLVSSDGKWEVKVDAANGEILKDEEESSKKLDKYLDRLSGAKFDYAEAINKVMDEVGEGDLTELELDDEHGTVVWEADVRIDGGNKREVIVDAATGEILKNEIDT